MLIWWFLFSILQILACSQCAVFRMHIAICSLFFLFFQLLLANVELQLLPSSQLLQLLVYVLSCKHKGLPFVSQPGVRTHYVEMGSGPPVLLCHGFPESWYSWRFQVSHVPSLQCPNSFECVLTCPTPVDPSLGCSRVQGLGSGHEGIWRVHVTSWWVNTTNI